MPVERERKARNGPAMIVDDDGQPRPVRLPVVAYCPEIKLGVIGLPDLVRALCLSAVDQIVCVAISLLAIDSEGPHILRDGPDDAVNSVIPGQVLAFLAGNAAHFPVNRARTKGRSLQGEALGKAAKLC